MMKHWKLSNLKLAAVPALLAASAVPDASAALAVSNGNFEAGGGFKADVIDWFDLGPRQGPDRF